MATSMVNFCTLRSFSFPVLLLLPLSAPLVLASAYDATLARKFASFSSVTYCDADAAVLDWSCAPCRDSFPTAPQAVRIINGGPQNATRVIVGKVDSESACVIGVRGTDNTRNLLSDAEFWMSNTSAFAECDGCEVHAGYYSIWQSMSESVVEALQEIGCGSSSQPGMLYVTGHSMGAGIAALAMFALENSGFQVGYSYTFEAPRIGNQAFVEAFSKRFERKFPVFRVTHARDPIPHVPPTFLGYRHTQTEVYYNATGQYRVCEGQEDPLCAAQFSNVAGMFLSHTGDHCASPLVPNGDICNPLNCEPRLQGDLII